jgi:diaminopimelate decarboxylase
MANWQIPGFLDEIDGRLHIDGVDVIPLAESFGTPIFIFSEDRIRHNCAEVQTAFQQWQFKTQVFYASKANSNLSILHIIRDAGLDIEVNSGGELYKALKAGFSPDQIIFNGVAKTEQEIREAISSTVFSINVDSLYELGRIAEIAAALNMRANIALRMVPDVETGSHGGLETGTHASKFGISQHELLPAYQQAIDDPLHLNLLGLHIHIGAQTIETSKFTAGFETLLRLAAECFAHSGKPFSTLNMGGGYPVTFIKPGDETVSAQIIADPDHPLGDLVSMLRAGPSPADIARETIGRLAAGQFDQMLDRIAPGFRKTVAGTRFLLEPGSRVVADTAVLLTTIHNHKKRLYGAGHWLLLDAGFNTLLDTFSYNWYYHLGSANRAADPHDTFYRLGGPLCDSGDIYHDSEMLGRLPELYALPENLAAGDRLMFFDVGAYTLEQMCQYNGQRRAAALLVRSAGDVRLIRRRDNYSDLIEQDVDIYTDSNNPEIE